jgi:NSS family neurotransmitter:Na+ symporter
LLLTYAVYAQKEVNIIENSIYTGVGNNIASIVSGLAIIPAVFALSANTEAAQAALASGNQGLAFITIPQIFSKMSGGAIFSIVFFLALFFAALSSMIAMLELAVRVLIDFGVERKKSVAVIFVLIVIAGAPSAVSMDFFDNQDWVWGIGLLISGFFFTIIASKLNQQQFPINKESLMFKLFFYFLLPFEFLAMFVWWLWQSVQWYPQNWWNPFETLSLGSCLLQWAVLIIISVLFMKKANELLEKRG